MINESKEKERASNIIWNASADYSFKPGIMMFDENGRADLYLNYIIGAVHKYYDYSLLQSFFNDLKGDAYHELLENLMWIGLEGCAYQKGKSERPVLESLRRNYSEKVLSKCDTASANYLFDEIRIAHFKRALGENPKMTGMASKILNDLEFDKFMDTEQIILRMNKIINTYFGFGFIPNHYGQQRKPHHHKIVLLRLFKIVPARYSGEVNFRRKEHKLNKIASYWFKLIESRDKYQREYIQNLYGTSVMPEPRIKAIEQVICSGNHRNCHLHFTRGEYIGSINDSRNAVNHKNAVLKQCDRNKKHYQENLARNNNTISKLTNIIRNAMQINLESSSSRSEYGKLVAGKVWRNVYFNDEKIFIKNLKDDIGNLTVDIMIDASSSQTNRQEIIAGGVYIIAESLTRCRIPVRVYSFFSEGNYTVINLFRDYGENSKNDKIFNYYSTGSNRDGLAIHTALYMMKNTVSEHKILIVLSDGVPYDTQGIPKSKLNHAKYDYIGEPGVNDTALEVRKGRQYGIPVLCVFTGLDDDISDAKKIYGHDLAFIKSPERFADIVGVLMKNELKNM